MGRSTRVFIGLLVCAFTAGNLVVTVTAATTKAGAARGAASGARQSPTRSNSPFGTGSERQNRLADASPKHVHLASLPHGKPFKDKHADKLHLVKDPKAYNDAKKHPNGKKGIAITPETAGTGPGRFGANAGGPKVPTTFDYSWDGINSATDSGNVGHGDEPPDTQIAVGTTYVVEMVNELVQIYARDGTPQGGGTYTLDDFFAVNSHWTPLYFPGQTFTTSDPRVLYDATSSRWFANVLAYDPDTWDSLVLMAVSDTSNPTGDWGVYAVDGEFADAGVGEVCDQPKIGVSSDKIGIACTLFSGPTSPQFDQGVLMVMSKSRAMSGLTLHETQYADVTFFGMVPAQNLTGSVSTLYLTENLTAVGIAGTGVITVTGNVALAATNAVLTGHVVDMPATDLPVAAQQKDSADELETGDDRFLSAFVLAGNLYTGGADSCTPGGDTTPRSCLRLIKASVSTWTLVQSDTAGLVGKYILMPTVGVNSSGDIGIVYSTSSSTEYASVAQALQPAGSAGIFVGSTVFAGTGPYVHSTPQNPARWGDYSSVAMDPSAPGELWIGGEYSNGPSDGTGGTTWGTHVARFNAHTQACTSPDLVPSDASPQAPGADITLTASATCLDPQTPDFQFWIKAPGATAFTLAQGYGGGDTYDWSSHVTLGTYTLEVRVRAVDEVKSYDALKDISYVITANPCSLPTLTPDKASPQPINATVTLTATTVCGAPPELYQFMVRTPDLIWHVAQPYSSSNTYAWSAFNTVAGSYLLQVRVKNTGSLAAYDNYRNVGYTRVLCTSPTLDTGGGTSPFVSGFDSVTMTATASCNGGEQYQFRYRDPANVWHILQAYSPTNTANWAANYKAGNYLLEVEVRPTGSTAAYVTLKDIAFTLSGCTLPTLSADKSSPQLGGANVSWTADATCTGAGKEFKFTVRTPAGVTTTGQDWGASNTFPWITPAGSGTYTITAFARNVNAINDLAGDVAKAVTFSVGNCSAVTLVPDNASPQPSGAVTVGLTADASCNAAAQFQFRYKDTAGVFHALQSYSTDNTADWPANFKSGNYVLEVQVRPTGSTAAYVTLKDIPFTLTGCTTPTLASDKVSPQRASTMVTWTAGASCTGASAEFKFAVKKPGATVATTAQDWSGTNTFPWTTPATAGTYTITVYARNAGAANDTAGDVAKAVTFAVGICSSISLDLGGATSPYVSGSGAIAMTADASCNPAVQFQFRYKDTAGVFHTLQGYSADNTFDWPANYKAGNYVLEAQARPAGSTAAYVTLKDIPVTLTGCTLPTLAADKASPQLAATAVTWTAGAGCTGASPEFKFTVRTPAGVTTTPQDWGANAQFVWNAPATLGTYTIITYARNTGAASDTGGDVSKAATFAVGICSAVSLTPDQTSPLPSGGVTVGLTADASCNAAPQFQFRYKDTANVFHTLQGYSADNTADWPANFKAGNYVLEAQVRPAASTAAYVTLKDIAFTLTGCGSPTLVADHTSPQLAGTTVIWSAGASCTGTPEFQYSVRTPAGVTTVVRTWGDSSFGWVAPATLGTYTITVQARNVGANNALTGDVSASVSFAVNVCTTPTLDTGAASSPYASGAGDVTLTALASCKTTTQYLFRYKDPAKVWHTLRGYSTVPTAIWHADFKAGTYVLEVQARPTGSTAAYVTYKDLTFTLTGCGAPTVTPDLASPQIRGTTVTFTASATCSGTPQFKFLVRSPAGVTTVGRDWNTSDAFVWNSPAVAGTYTVTVLARNAGANEDAGDASKAIAYKLS